MSNHFHVLLEVPPLPEGGHSDQELFQRLGVFYSEAQVAEVVREMEESASVRTRGEIELPPLNPETGQPLTPTEELEMATQRAERRREEIRSRHTRRNCWKARAIREEDLKPERKADGTYWQLERYD